MNSFKIKTQNEILNKSTNWATTNTNFIPIIKHPQGKNNTIKTIGKLKVRNVTAISYKK